jgi:RHS repeat-associated protein
MWRTAAGGGAGWFYYHYDGLGNVVAISDVNGTVVESYEYDVFGEPMVYDANGTEISESSVGNPYLFTGRRFDDETGLYYYRARYYSPSIGRFMQPDPVAMYMQYASVSQRTRDRIPGTYLFPPALQKFLQYDPIGRYLQMDPAGRFLQMTPFGFPVELNLYSYCWSDPINLTDPYGLGWFKDWWKKASNWFHWLKETLKAVTSVPDPKDMKDLYDNCKSMKDNLNRHNDNYKEGAEDEEGIYPACRK